MGINSGNLTIMVKDMDASIAFYTGIGLNLQNRWENNYAQLSAPGLVIGLHPSDGSFAAIGSGNLSIGFVSDDFDSIPKQLSDAGIAFSASEDEGGRFIHFHDPDGTVLYFIKTKWQKDT